MDSATTYDHRISRQSRKGGVKKTEPLNRLSGAILSGVAPANQTKERSVHELFAGAFWNRSSMWILLVFPRKNTRIYTKMGDIQMKLFVLALSLVWFCRGDSWFLESRQVSFRPPQTPGRRERSENTYRRAKSREDGPREATWFCEVLKGTCPKGTLEFH